MQTVHCVRKRCHAIVDHPPKVEDEPVEALGQWGEACEMPHHPLRASRSASVPTACCTLAKPASRKASASSFLMRGMRAGPENANPVYSCTNEAPARILVN